MTCLFISSDLFSSSQFASAIRQSGVNVESLLAIPASPQAPPAVVVVDLETAGTVESIPAWIAAGLEVVAFGPHVKTALLEQAHQAGAGHVLTRGQAMRDLGPLVAGLVQKAT